MLECHKAEFKNINLILGRWFLRRGASIEVMIYVGEKNINGKIVIDIANPLDFPKGAPPSLSISSPGEFVFANIKVVR